MAKNGKKKSTFTKVISTLLGILVILVCMYFKIGDVGDLVPAIESLLRSDLKVETTAKPTEIPNNKSNVASSYSDDSLEVYFFDVGQADAILLLTDSRAMLVDTGNAGDAELSDKIKDKINLTHELKRLGVEFIDVLVATHPHEDHMGSMYKIVKSFDIGDIYVTAYDEKFTKNYYDRFWEAVQEKDVHVISPTTLSENEIKAKIEEYNAEVEKKLAEITESGEKISEEDLPQKITYNASDYIRLGDAFKFGNATVTMIAPASSEYSDTNDYSIVLMVEFEDVKLLLTGDSGKEAEEEMLEFAQKNGFNLDVDILKVSHHGSRTANTEAFITAVAPEYAVVMVEEGNSYGLPDEDVIERLQKHNANIYTTMEHGDIKLVINDGEYEFDFSYDHEVKE